MSGIEYGYAAGQEHELCAKRADRQARMLCGRRVSHILAAQPDGVPGDLHDVCRELLPPGPFRGQVESADVGVCPVCGGDVYLTGGRVGDHCRWLVRGGKTVVSNEPCDGAGMLPEAW